MNTTPSDDIDRVDHEILRTDPDQRRKIQRLIVAMVVIALLFWWFALPALKDWVTVPDESTYVRRMETIFYALAAVLFATSGYALWFARRILVSAQSPPPGTWVWRDTRVLRGDHARARGWWVVACALSFVLLGGFTAFSMPRMLEGQLRAGAPMRPVRALPVSGPHLPSLPLRAPRAPPVASPHG
jgi:hypothetical protein